MHAPRACVCNDLHRLLVDQKHPLTIACLVVLEHRRTKTLTHFLPIDTPAKKKKNPTFARKIHHRFQSLSLDGTFTDNPCKDLTFTHESCKSNNSLTLYYSVDLNILERRSFLKVSYEKQSGMNKVSYFSCSTSDTCRTRRNALMIVLFPLLFFLLLHEKAIENSLSQPAPV